MRVYGDSFWSVRSRLYEPPEVAAARRILSGGSASRTPRRCLLLREGQAGATGCRVWEELWLCRTLWSDPAAFMAPASNSSRQGRNRNLRAFPASWRPQYDTASLTSIIARRRLSWLVWCRGVVQGEVFNVVDDDLPSSRQFLRQYKKNVRASSPSTCRTVVSHALCYLWEAIRGGRRDNCPRSLTARRWYAEWRRTRYSNEKLKSRLGWTPKVPPRKDCGIIFKAARKVSGVLKVAIVGCGKIADAHASQIQYLKDCEIVGVCDREPLMARQL